jgi:hypothetical protein
MRQKADFRNTEDQLKLENQDRTESHNGILEYFESGAILAINRLAELAPILSLSTLAREAGINAQTLQAKIRRQTPLSGSETARVV